MIMRPLAPEPATALAAPGPRWPFGFGPRFLLLLAAGVALIIPSWIDRRAILLLLAWNLLVVTLWVADLRRIPARTLQVTRVWRAPLALGVESRVELTVANHGNVPMRITFTDDTPGALRRTVPSGSLSVNAHDVRTAGYPITPTERGDVTVGAVALRCRSPWGLAERWLRAATDQTVRVYPDLFESRRQAMFLIRSRQVAIERRRARASGLGRDFESLREYQPGDEARDVCWTATARRAKLVTRVYQPERSQAVWILVDGGRLLRARVGDRMKLDRVVDAALGLAEVALAAGDRVGLVTYGRRVRQQLSPNRGHHHFRGILDALATLPSERAEADHAGAAAAVLSAQKQRALIVWLTDLSETAGVPDVIESAARLSPQHVVIFALIRQPELIALAAEQPSTEEDMYRVLAAQETLERRDVLLRGLRRRGALVLDMPPEAPAAALIDQYLTVKERSLV